MAGGPWFRIGRNGRSRPIATAGWGISLLLVAVEFVGTFLLILVPRMEHVPIGWDRGLGWFLLSVGNIAFFILLAGAKTAREAGDDDR